MILARPGVARFVGVTAGHSLHLNISCSSLDYGGKVNLGGLERWLKPRGRDSDFLCPNSSLEISYVFSIHLRLLSASRIKWCVTLGLLSFRPPGIGTRDAYLLI
jgi:hypothetical protein